MVTRSADQATDCTAGFTDWTTIGTRILEAALIASAIHAQECRESAMDRDPVFGRLEAQPAEE
ncbi:MAG TPA: hypothetical protein PKG54_12240 [Phycisphaerae bacterium]|jgi:hypothetical protein|nr:hypothetical protein [Phycisphaerae bacterium]HOB75281.1 hypothetical protein [Phycisphaerae bacterium]HOJ55043.1 hypothetical protein [Phycisphaerae bacterium]HOL27784.1 hypothetical protein [Phycisphaerae bacterium]HPP21993.1 hypothetical protein [Phycisphaerae bacterium]